MILKRVIYISTIKNPIFLKSLSQSLEGSDFFWGGICSWSPKFILDIKTSTGIDGIKGLIQYYYQAQELV
jgi:hypothetical protein